MASVQGFSDAKSIRLAQQDDLAQTAFLPQKDCLVQNGCLTQNESLATIAALINPLLAHNIRAKVACKGDRLGILLEAIGVPDRAQATLIQPGIRQGFQKLQLQKLQLQNIQTLKVYGRQIGQVSPAWCLVFPIALSNQQKLYGYFVIEAQGLLENLEQDLLTLREDHSLAKIHNMLLAVHTIKGGSASVGLQTIAKIAHGLEDVFAALRHSQEELDLELELLLLQGYDCLRIPLMAQFAGVQIDEPEALNRVASVIAQIQAKLRGCFDPDLPLLTSVDLGFDVVQNLFQVGVAQRLGDLERSLLSPHATQLAVLLHEKAEFFLGVAESMNLPGFGAIAQTVLTALQVNPHRVLEIATVALADFSQGRAAVLGGDRQAGGFPSVDLKKLATLDNVSSSPKNLAFQTVAYQEEWRDHTLPLLDVDLPTLEAELSLDEVFGHYEE
ncbi:MAG: Hpt domain-containing protein [Timaviella obliquedivisa GSE-PSE-MK23-08B]|jgi:HPt (histidine-containing phosphotransfer) domain-containing protein|nr:Hpt domain-containing protein [Timaviella obliquedivisa GSE-PSE-MK23-08B]